MLDALATIDAANPIIQPIYGKLALFHGNWKDTKLMDTVVRKNGSPMMYPMLKLPLCRGKPVPLFMSEREA